MIPQQVWKPIVIFLVFIGVFLVVRNYVQAGFLL